MVAISFSVFKEKLLSGDTKADLVASSSLPQTPP